MFFCPHPCCGSRRSRRSRTAVCFDVRHAEHAPRRGLPFKPEDYLDLCHEVPERATALWEALGTAGLLSGDVCIQVDQVEATSEELMAPADGGAPNNAEAFYTYTVHSPEHVALGGILFADPASYIVDSSEKAARIAAGGVLAVTKAVCRGEAANGFAIVRPPGHHACTGCGCVQGFCVYNNVAVASANARKADWYTKDGGIIPTSLPERLAIIDFDVHHGDGVQQIFYRDAGVLYISIHRGAFDALGLDTVDKGGRGKGFFPGTGLANQTGDGDGVGFNVNIPFEEPGMGDAEYQHAFDQIVMPIARQYQPDLVLVCAGFDAAAGDANSKAEFKVSARCFGWMVRQLMTLAEGKLVLALEGGYDISEICAGGTECLKALQGHAEQLEARGAVHEHALDTISRVVAIQRAHWNL